MLQAWISIAVLVLTASAQPPAAALNSAAAQGSFANLQSAQEAANSKARLDSYTTIESDNTFSKLRVADRLVRVRIPTSNVEGGGYSNTLPGDSQFLVETNMGLVIDPQLSRVASENNYDPKLLAEHPEVILALVLADRTTDARKYAEMTRKQRKLMLDISAIQGGLQVAAPNSSLARMMGERVRLGYEIRSTRESLGPLLLVVQYHPVTNGAAGQNDHAMERQPVSDLLIAYNAAHPNSKKTATMTRTGWPISAWDNWSLHSKATFFHGFTPIALSRAHFPDGRASDRVTAALAVYYEDLNDNFLPMEDEQLGDKISMKKFLNGLRTSQELGKELRVSRKLASASRARLIAAGLVQDLGADPATERLRAAELALVKHSSMMDQLGSFDILRFSLSPPPPSNVAASLSAAFRNVGSSSASVMSEVSMSPFDFAEGEGRALRRQREGRTAYLAAVAAAAEQRLRSNPEEDAWEAVKKQRLDE